MKVQNRKGVIARTSQNRFQCFGSRNSKTVKVELMIENNIEDP